MPPAPSGSGHWEASGESAVAVNANAGIISTGPGATIYTTPAVQLPPAQGVAGPRGQSNHNLPRPPSALFVGRDDDVTRLGTALAAESEPVTRILVGLGGVGKTSLTLQYAHRYRDAYTTVWWITADNPDAITAGLAALTSRLLPHLATPATTNALAEWAITWFQTHPGWLVVFDNADDPSHLAPVISQLDTGRHLITSRRTAGWHHLAAPLRLDVLSPNDAAELLMRTAGRHNVSERLVVGELAAELGHLPLALEQAGAYVHNHAISFAAYLERVRRYPARMFATAYAGSTDRRTVARVWRVTLSTIADRDPLAVEILRTLAWFAPDRLPQELITRIDDDILAVDDALALLAGYSMITLTPPNLRVHRLVQAVARTADPADPLRTEEAILVARDRAARILLDSLPGGGGAEEEPGGASIAVPQWEEWRALRPHIEAFMELMPHDEDNADIAVVLHETSRFLLDQGYVSQAARYSERALAARERVLGSENPDTLSARNQLGNIYRAAGDLGRAIPLYERTVSDRERVLGADHPDTLSTRNYLANAYRDSGRVDRSIPLYERTLADRERVLGPDHPETLISRNNLASGYRDAGDLPRSISFFEATRDRAEQALGQDHPRTLLFRNNLATAYEAAGDLTRALPLYERTLNDRENLLGTTHPDTLTTRNNLAGALQDSNGLHRAIELYQLTLADSERVLGPEHPRTLLVRSNLADALWQSGNREGAKSLWESVLADSQRLLGDDHPDTLLVRSNLAGALFGTGDDERATELWESVVADSQRVLGDDHPDTLLARCNLARARRSVELSEQALADCVRVLGNGHPRTLSARRDLALAHDAAGDPMRAVAQCEAAYRASVQTLGAGHARSAAIKSSLAGLLRGLIVRVPPFDGSASRRVLLNGV
ncbi:FxSxx-COOH system tetratricopeptide repeat protein [Streptomyces sp. BE230]|uniref:FxSxx-COOH system tetratricopeptide repeat protein n=1 Tax=Streptomyces sp. BE230 TaxID=3002526 RepID=UPI002ED37BE2|nr:FxSxx-COOH system tetratricopeptide repeat protein [Streptomyces sp. BE230]